MKCLAELCEDAETLDNYGGMFLIIHPKSGPFNGKFLDPFLGLMELKGHEGKAIRIEEFDKYKTIGMFV